MIKNYISVSAVIDKTELDSVYSIYKNEEINFPLAIGYQVSNKSINQGTQNPRQPKVSELPDLCSRTLDFGLLPAIHYYSKDHNLILNDLEKLANIGIDPNQNLIQMNTLPTELEIIKNIKEMGYKIIFKVGVVNKLNTQGGYSVWKGNDVQDVSNGDIYQLLDQVYQRSNFIDYVMFDPSHGTNLELDLNENSLAIRFGKSICENKMFNHLGIVYAGGIKPTNVKKVTNSLKYFFPDRFSIDVESGVRFDNKLDFNLVRNYFTNYKSALL